MTPRARGTLWFVPVADKEKGRRRSLTRDRVVAEALTIISVADVEAVSMHAPAARLGVVPGALYRHVGSKEQLHVHLDSRVRVLGARIVGSLNRR
jgi:AcrR family transcriptional regulator